MYGKKNNKRMLTKKGISPLIATILLIGFVVVVGVVAFVWGKSFIQGTAEKEGAISQAEIKCQTLSLNVFQNANNQIVVENNGQSNVEVLQVMKRTLTTQTLKRLPKDTTDQLIKSSFPLKPGNQIILSSDLIAESGETDIIPSVIPKGGSSVHAIPCVDKKKTITL